MKFKSLILKTFVALSLFGVVGASLSGCSKKNKPNEEEPPAAVVNSVSVSPGSAKIKVNETITLTANVSGENNAPLTVSWSSQDTSICSVNSSGLVTGLKEGTTTIVASSTFDPAKQGTCTVSVVSEEAELTENEIIELLNEDEYVIYGNGPTGENEDRVVVDEKTKPLEIKETYLETFEDLSVSRLLVQSVDTNASYQIIDGTDERSIDGTKALYLETAGDYAGLTFSGLKYTENATYRLRFDYKVLQKSNDFFFQFRSYKGGYDYDSYHSFDGDLNVVCHFDDYYDLSNFTDYKLSLFPRNYAGKLVVDNLEITRVYSRPRLTETFVSSDGDLRVGGNVSFNYTFEDPNKLFEETATSYYWFSSLNAQGLNKNLICRNQKTITLTSTEDNKYLGVNYKTSCSMSETDEWSANGRQKDSIEGSILSSATVGGVAPAISQDHIFETGVALSENFEDYNPLESNINFYASNDKKSQAFTQGEDVISGNKSLYVDSIGFFEGVKTSGYVIKPNTKYVVEFDYKFLKKPSSFYVQFRSQTSNNYDVFTPLDINSVELEQIYHFSHEFTVLNRNDYYLQMFGNNDACTYIIDNLSLTEYEEEVHTDEPTTNPTSLDNVGDYALETFGYTNDKVLNYDGTNVVHDDLLDSYAYSFVTNGNKEIYIPFEHSLITSGIYTLDIDYVVKQKGTGNFYFSIYVNDYNSDSSELQVNDLTLNTKLHFTMTFDVTDKMVTKNILKVFTYYASGVFEIVIDNVKITKQRTPTEDDPDFVFEADGGTVEVANSDYIGENAHHFHSNGVSSFEKLYVKTLPKLSEGTYRLTFDYCLTSFNTNTMYIAIYQVGNVCKKEVQDFNVTLNEKHEYSIEFTLTGKLDFVRIMTGQNAGTMDFYINNLAFTRL